MRKLKSKYLKSLVCLLICICMVVSVTGCQRKGNENYNPTKAADENITSAPKEEPTEEPTKPAVDPNAKLIALTIDDGPYSPVTDRILDVLEENGALATFFVVGERVDNNPSYQVSLKRAFDMGCEIGSHTYSHKYLKSSVSAETVKQEIEKSNTAIKNVTGGDVIIMRPPGGFCNDNVSLPEIMWSVDSLDWKNKNAEKNYNNVVNNVFDGCIVLMHDLYEPTADAIERFVPELIADGYQFVTVSQLMEARGITMEGGKSYAQAKPQVEEPTEAPTEAPTSAVSETAVG